MKAVLPIADINHLLVQVANIATSSHNDPRYLSLFKLIACVLNKQVNDSQIIKFVDSIVMDQWTSKHDYDRRKESLELMSWVASLETGLTLARKSASITDSCTGL